MISNTIYEETFELSDMLHHLQHEQSYPVRAAIARIIYWDYSFNFQPNRDFVFTRNALKFIGLDGIAILLKFACGTIVPLRTPGRPQLPQYLREWTHTLVAQSINMSHHPRHMTMADVEFQMPAFALRYDTATLVNEAHEVVSMRRLAIEILSEMSNYALYRGEIGRLQGALCQLIATLKTLIRYFLATYKTAEARNSQTLANNNTVFMIERLMNTLANLSFDGGSKMSACRTFFEIENQMLGMSTENMECVPGVFQATETLACFVLNEIGGDLLAFGDAIGCPGCLRNAARLLCNTLGYSNKRIFYRLAMYDVNYSLKLWLQKLTAVRDEMARNVGDEAALELERIRIGIRAVDRAFHWIFVGMSELYKTHLNFKAGFADDDEDEDDDVIMMHHAMDTCL